MIELEIDTLKKVHLSEALHFLEKADDVDAEEYAEKTLEIAEKKVDTAKDIELRRRKRFT